ncbi:MAG: thymidine phosphorylase, partial [bacterium]|nr:thymidine phosphorylase [bacterium]
MRVYDIIFKKREGLPLTKDEIRFIIEGYTNGSIPDYQVSAFLMACFLKELSHEETKELTKAMLESGDSYDLSEIPGIKVDKHSTGGVGDKVSIPLAPLVASFGIPVPMMSGRGLGHTGGTLDKLEAIPGFSTNLTYEKFIDTLKSIKMVMIGQSDMIAPADKKLYALRDVTATVDNISLITASIMSKKIAEGADAYVFDVKVGKGAFMRSIKMAKQLSSSLINIAELFNKKARAIISNMDQPLGNKIGNALEIEESIDLLKGNGPKDLLEIVEELGGLMLFLGGKTDSPTSGKEMILGAIDSGSGLEKFAQMVKVQGGNPSVVNNPEEVLPQAQYTYQLRSPESGWIKEMDAKEIGISALILGAGRENKESVIDPAVGIVLKKKVGDKVERNEVIAEIKY